MKNKEKNLYICHTYYHVLIAIIKQIKSNVDADIIITTNFSQEFIIRDNLLIDRIKQSKIFQNTIIFDYSKIEESYKNGSFVLNRIRLGNKIIRQRKYNFKQYDKIYIFNDRNLIGYILNKLNLKYNILEDGTDCFKSKYRGLFIKNESFIKKHIKRFLKIYERAESPRIESIEVNDKEDLFIKHHNIIECNKRKLFSNLNTDQKERIIKIFLKDFKNVSRLSNSIIILTQPFFEDGNCSTEEEKVNLYKDIIDKHKNEGKIIIKTHPREITNYTKYFNEDNNIEIISEKFPIEILNFFDIKFKKIISVSSTAINSIENVQEKIEIGHCKR